MPTDHLHNEAMLVQQAADGSEAAFREVFRYFYSRLVFYAQHLSLSREEAEDAVMETFTRYWTARKGFDNLQKLRSYLYTVTRNVTIDTLRKKKFTTTFDGEHFAEDDDYAERERIHADTVAVIMREIDRLPENCREIVMLTYRDGLSTKEIAEQLNISPTNVTTRRSRAMSLLKIALADRPAVWLATALSSLRFL